MVNGNTFANIATDINRCITNQSKQTTDPSPNQKKKDSSDEVPNYSQSTHTLFSTTDEDIIDDDYILSSNVYTDIEEHQTTDSQFKIIFFQIIKDAADKVRAATYINNSFVQLNELLIDESITDNYIITILISIKFRISNLTTMISSNTFNDHHLLAWEFNLHHTIWQSTYSINDRLAKKLADLLTDHKYQYIGNEGTPTHIIDNTIDLVFASPKMQYCKDLSNNDNLINDDHIKVKMFTANEIRYAFSKHDKEKDGLNQNMLYSKKSVKTTKYNYEINDANTGAEADID
ncbi:uncharacterized protein ASCRUDRAFT_10678 [Ascoidea rubescens DSM 1968]|uniref:Endonuclease/exonuclease/phosphatase domain-containing protein n=1 Tax=Ascoidea rubescens DSM 1968 TaxID=1344418 RepID=A0A1D2V8E3_9ASCO|nr:hypothetical protein ASCRUDRAFT_10678 [Ascoidea rubescens DSM 1968]ODV57900.1 hypothetical protein ASCRUDRAFT_10678 [Ascoidea rubescens DSM 1968]